jgi:hypothetical protein
LDDRGLESEMAYDKARLLGYQANPSIAVQYPLVDNAG